MGRLYSDCYRLYSQDSDGVDEKGNGRGIGSLVILKAARVADKLSVFAPTARGVPAIIMP